MSAQGTIRKRNGRYFLRLYTGGHRTRKDKNGKLIRDLKTGEVRKFPIQREFALGSEYELPSRKHREDAADNIRLRLGMAGNASRTTLERFAEFWFLPVADARLRQSTSKDYRWRFGKYIKGRKEARLELPMYRTRDVQNILDGIAWDFPHLSKASMQRNKALLSAIFRHAVVAGFRSQNPVRDTFLVTGRKPTSVREDEALPVVAKARVEPAVYDLATVRQVIGKLALVPELRVAVAIAAFAGLRLAELNGLEWSDIDVDAISVRRSVWHGHVNEPKSKASKASVPIVAELRGHLDTYRKSQATGALFTSDLKALGRYHLPEAFESAKSQWHGWHGFRRGLASTLFQLGADDLIVMRILRQSRVIATRDSYIERFDSRVLDAMNLLSQVQGGDEGKGKSDKSHATSPEARKHR